MSKGRLDKIVNMYANVLDRWLYPVLITSGDPRRIAQQISSGRILEVEEGEKLEALFPTPLTDRFEELKMLLQLALLEAEYEKGED